MEAEMNTDPTKSKITAIRKDGLTFIQCLDEALRTPELLAQFDRLHGTNLSMRGHPLEIEIDKSSGRLDKDFREFAEFVWKFVFLSMPLMEPTK
jgi:hypothetical protein